MNNFRSLIYLSAFILLPLIIFSCIRDNDSERFGEFPKTPTNLIDFNTEFDDYNSTAPSFGETFPFCFSSNRNSSGSNYDIIYKLMTIDFSKGNRELQIFNNTEGNLSVVIENSNIRHAMNTINTKGNEYGPYLIPRGRVQGGTNINNGYETYILMYSSDNEGDQDIMFTHNLDDESYAPPMSMNFVNSEFDDSYPTFDMNNSHLLFSSNREGNFDIYSNVTDSSKDILEIFNTTVSESMKEINLSSENDDKCPFIIDDFLVFSSNRPGGHGGYDLYYSTWENGQWSMPINFGDSINSEYDEYRPIVRQEVEFKNDIMIFSSNRPGGKGGFDLYYVGIEELRE